CHEAERGEAPRARRRRLIGDGGRLDDAEELASLLLLHVLAQQRLFVALLEGPVELLGRFVVARDLLELLLTLRHLFDALLVRRDRVEEALLVGLQVRHARIVRRRSRHSRGRGRAARRGVRDLPLEIRDLRLLRDDVGILVGVARRELGQLLAQESQARRGAILRGREVDAASGTGGALLALEEPRLPVAIHAQLRVEALDREHVHLRLIGQPAVVALLVVPDALLLLIERLLRLLELDLEEGGGGVRLALALLRVADDVEARERVGDVGGLL